MAATNERAPFTVRTPEMRGTRRAAEIPDTLDLAERARLAVNVLTRAVVPQRFHAAWHEMNIGTSPPHFRWANWLTYKWLEALPRMRSMSGSELNLDVERDMMQSFVDRHGLTFEQGNDDEGAVFARFGVPAQPAWVFVSADGDVERELGALGDDELAAKLEALAAT